MEHNSDVQFSFSNFLSHNTSHEREDWRESEKILSMEGKKVRHNFLTIIGGSLQNISHWKERYENKEMNDSESNEAIIHFGRNKKKNLL